MRSATDLTRERTLWTYQVYEASAGEPDANEGRDELAEADTVRRLQNIQVLKYIRNRHQPQGSREAQA